MNPEVHIRLRVISVRDRWDGVFIWFHQEAYGIFAFKAEHYNPPGFIVRQK